MSEATEVQSSDITYRIQRATTKESSYLVSGFIPVEYDNTYKASVIVKKGTDCNLFGFRMSGTYPDRVDAVFDLEKGELKAVKKAQDFQNEKATIEDYGNGWYKCTISAQVSTYDIRILLGSTSINKDVSGWEGKTEKLCDVYFVPSSVIIEEIPQ